MKFHQKWILGAFLGVISTVALVSGIGAEKMATTQDEPGIFCKLSTAEMRERLGELRAAFLTQVRGVDELETGYRYWFEKTPERLSMLTEFIDFESQCCAFLQFDLSLAPEAKRVSLSLTGGEGTKAFLESMMQSVEFDWQASLHES